MKKGAKAAATPNLDVRLTRSQSGNILDIDFEFGAHGTPGCMCLRKMHTHSPTRFTGVDSTAAAAPAPAPTPAHAAAPCSAVVPAQPQSTAVVLSGRKLKIPVCYPVSCTPCQLGRSGTRGTGTPSPQGRGAQPREWRSRGGVGRLQFATLHIEGTLQFACTRACQHLRLAKAAPDLDGKWWHRSVPCVTCTAKLEGHKIRRRRQAKNRQHMVLPTTWRRSP